MVVEIAKREIKSYFKSLSEEEYWTQRIPYVENETLVPLLYAITGSNLTCDHYRNGLKDIALHRLSTFFIYCIDHKRVKEIRQKVIELLLKDDNNALIRIDDVVEIEVKDNTTYHNLTFPEKKEMINDVKIALPSIIRNAIDFERKINLNIIQ